MTVLCKNEMKTQYDLPKGNIWSNLRTYSIEYSVETRV